MPRQRASGEGDRRRATGSRGEEIAAAHLRTMGFEIVARNVRTRYGELDIVAREGSALVFVEVRTRRGASVGDAEESITPRKRERLTALAEAYLQTLPGPVPDCRIDVVAVDLGLRGEVRRVELLRNAV